MRDAATLPLIDTVGDRCRTCYQCVRECPAKAIRIVDGQASVIAARCIGCGSCVRECNQHAKVAIDDLRAVQELLASGQRVGALLAPSFPAEFADHEPARLVGMLRQLGFAVVADVGFGADLVALAYHRLLARREGKFISSTCPAIVGYVEKYHPDLVPALAPIVSPMVATARVARQVYGQDLQLVFIGPCLAKRREAASMAAADGIAQVLTFADLRLWLRQAGVPNGATRPADLDPPHAGMGAVFPIKRGLLQAAAIGEDLVVNDVVSAGGSTAFADAIREFAADNMDVRLLEVLCCNGCIMGAGMATTATLFGRRTRVSRYVKQHIDALDLGRWEADMERFAKLDLSRSFTACDQRLPQPSPTELARILARLGKRGPEDELNCGACGYRTCSEHALAVHGGLAEAEMCLPRTIEQLHQSVEEVQVSHRQLASAQEALMQSEKLASMGQLAAGIAHEINNPLGVVLMYTHLLLEETHDDEVRQDLQLVADEADRCKKIVSGLLHFARQNRVVRRPTDLGLLIDKAMRALKAPRGVEVAVHMDAADPVADLDRDQIVQVFSNLVSNAYTAMPEGGRLTIRVTGDDATLSLAVADTGIGIPRENQERVFHPFFTTKQIGKGTGLGLAITYGVVKMHRGTVTCQSNADPASGPTGTTFTVVLPRKGGTSEP
jgi:signal transduction histidine kinase/iron only hydrogenase large subunit-like protein